ncbi:MAG: tRNA dihydrouridine synthase DusB [Nitrospirota bacterium]
MLLDKISIVLTIGTLRLSKPLVLAPMAGISDLPFRLIAREFGCELAFIEMISARALVYRNRKTKEMLSTLPADRPLGVQLLGNDPRIVPQALENLRPYKFDIIDVNAACPVGKVTTRGEGAGLLKTPQVLHRFLKAVVAHADVPVTVKLRAGWDEHSINAREMALLAQDAGVHGLFIHGRTKVQGYSGSVDYRVIAGVKRALDIPVIASGDALSPQRIKKLFDETGCDGVAIARGALGNPWVFRDTVCFLENGVLPERPCLDELTGVMRRHLSLCIEYYGEHIGTMMFRKLFAWYIKGLSDVRPLKERAFQAKTKDEMVAIMATIANGRGDSSRGSASLAA